MLAALLRHPAAVRARRAATSNLAAHRAPARVTIFNVGASPAAAAAFSNLAAHGAGAPVTIFNIRAIRDGRGVAA
jgi:hypothetical protein